uniref:Uncharacterized protein n=1 Tax=Rhizophora mucronata TaxID=61149 RepID=A0A2P2IZT5_RHIMU
MSQPRKPSCGDGRASGKGSFTNHPLPRGQTSNKILKAALGCSPSSSSGRN